MSNWKQNLLPITTYVRIDVKRLFRDKVAIFFVFGFPLLFLVIFGSIFGGDNDISFRVGLLNQSDTKFAAEFEKQLQDNDVFNVDEEVNSLDDAKEKMNRSQLDATIILPDDFGVQKGEYPSGQATVLYSQSNQQAGQTLGTILEGTFKDINEKLAPRSAASNERNMGQLLSNERSQYSHRLRARGRCCTRTWLRPFGSPR